MLLFGFQIYFNVLFDFCQENKIQIFFIEMHFTIYLCQEKGREIVFLQTF